MVAKGDAITCTITNSRNTATIKVVKDFSDNSPAGAKVDLQIDGVTKKANAVDGDNTGFITVNTGTHTVGELEVAGTPLSDYTSSISCDTTPVTAGDGTTLGGIVVAKGDAITCTITNSRNKGSIELKKIWSSTSGQTTLNIGTSAGGSQTDTKQTGVAGAGPLTTGANDVNTGTYYVSESGGLTDDSSSLACTKNGDAYVPGADDSIVVGKGDTVFCTFTNTRRPGLDQGDQGLRGCACGRQGQPADRRCDEEGQRSR